MQGAGQALSQVLSRERPITEDEIISLRDNATADVLSHDYERGPQLLIAGPGTGKTYCLLKTIRRRLDNGDTSPDGFLYCTFTNATADKFRSEVLRNVPVGEYCGVTLHHVAAGIVHRHAGTLGLPAGFSVLVEDDWKAFVKHDLHALGVGDHSGLKESYARFQRNCYDGSASEDPFSSHYHRLTSFYESIDISESVFLAVQALQSDPSIASQESSKFDFVLVDEYQDFNSCEQSLIRLLVRNRGTLLVVGDDDQSIYSWRAARPEGIRSFRDDYPNCQTTHHLPVTTRLPDRVRDAAYTLIERIPSRESRLRPECHPHTNERAGRGYVISVNCPSAKQEAGFIAEALVAIQAETGKLSEVAILCPTKDLGRGLARTMQLRSPSISLRLDFEPTSRDPAFAAVAALKRFLARPEENLALRRLLDYLTEDAKGVSQLVATAIIRRSDLWHVVQEKSLLGSGQLGTHLARIVDALNEALIVPEVQRLAAAVQLPPLQRLQVGMSSEEAPTTPPTPPDAARMMTLFGSKGLECDYVFIPFMEESLRVQGIDEAEQTRLFFVALTRARIGVSFSWARTRQGRERYSADSGEAWGRKPHEVIGCCGLSPYLTPWGSTQSPVKKALSLIRDHAALAAEYDRRLPHS